MTLNAFERVFTNNCMYESYKVVPFMDSLAYTVQEFLYSDRAKDEGQDYRMDGRIKLYDFMSMTSYFIESLETGLGRATIKGYIEDIKQFKHSFLDEEKVEYEKGALLITGASYELITALLWATYIYANAIAQVPDSEQWKEAARMLYNLMKDYCLYPKASFAEHILIKQTKEAVQLMIMDIQKKAKSKNKPNTPQEQVSSEQKVKNIDDDAIKEISLHDKVRLDLLLRLILNDGANLEKHGNKVKAALIMQSITGLPLQTCKNYCSNRDLNIRQHNNEVLQMNTLLQALGMEIRL